MLVDAPAQVVESPGLTQHDAQERRGIQLCDHRRRRSSTSTAVLLVRFDGLGGSFRSRSRRVALTNLEGGVRWRSRGAACQP